MGAKTALGILKAVFRARHKNDADEFDKMIERLNDLRRVRDIVGHGRWIKDEERPRSICAASFRSSGKLGVEKHRFTPEELLGTAERINARVHEMAIFLQARGYWKPPRSPAPTRRPSNRSADRSHRRKRAELPNGEKP
jgi:hypothetical protein